MYFMKNIYFIWYRDIDVITQYTWICEKKQYTWNQLKKTHLRAFLSVHSSTWIPKLSFLSMNSSMCIPNIAFLSVHTKTNCNCNWNWVVVYYGNRWNMGVLHHGKKHKGLLYHDIRRSTGFPSWMVHSEKIPREFRWMEWYKHMANRYVKYPFERRSG